MRVIASRILLAAAILALAACLALGATIIRSYPRAAARDGVTGVSLGVHLLLYILLPLTLALLLGAAVLKPASWLQHHLDIGQGEGSGSRSALAGGMAVLSLAGAGVIVLTVASFLGANMVSAARHYSHGFGELAVVMLQNLVLSAPLLSLGGLLAWTGRILAGRPRAPD